MWKRSISFKGEWNKALITHKEGDWEIVLLLLPSEIDSFLYADVETNGYHIMLGIICVSS